jgi:hypothetical protein
MLPKFQVSSNTVSDMQFKKTRNKIFLRQGVFFIQVVKAE